MKATEYLVILFIFLLPFGETGHLPVLILLMLGIRDLFNGKPRFDHGTRLLVWLTVLLTVPLLIAAITAYDPVRTLRTALMFILYAIAGWHVIISFRKGLDEDLLLYGISAILLFWTADALLQFFSGENLFGWPYNGSRVTGIYDQNRWIGYTFAHLAPFFLETLRRHARRTHQHWVWLLSLPFLSVILLSGGRAAWLTTAIIMLIYPLYLLRIRAARRQHIALVAIGIAVTIGITIALSPALRYRIDQSMLAFSLNTQSLNSATSERIDVWSGGWKLFLDAPVIGHGTHAYDPLAYERGYTSKPYGHEHLYGLQVMVTTGIVGFAAYLLAFVTVFKKLLRSLSSGAPTAMPWLAALLILLPLNAHWNFYAPRPSSLMWVLLILAVAIQHNYSHHGSNRPK